MQTSGNNRKCEAAQASAGCACANEVMTDGCVDTTVQVMTDDCVESTPAAEGQLLC